MRAALGLMGATGRWRGVPFLRNKSLCSTVCTQLHSSKRALPAHANPDAKDQFDSCMKKNWSEWGIKWWVGVRSCIYVYTAASCAVLLLKKRLNSNWSYPAHTAYLAWVLYGVIPTC